MCPRSTFDEARAPTVGPNYDELVAQLQGEYAELAAMDDAKGSVKSMWCYVERSEKIVQRCSLVASMLLVAALGVGVLNVLLPQLLPCVTHPEVGHREVAIGAALPSLSVLLSLFFLRIRSAGGQMLLRGLLWSSATLGALASVSAPDFVPVLSAAGALFCGGALLVLGEQGLEPERYTGAFAPAAHRGVLTLMMILSVADAQTLITWMNASQPLHIAPGIAGLVMAVGIAGLFRLRFWGLLVNLFMNIAIAVTGWLGWLHLPMSVVVFLTATAAIQVGLAGVVLRAVRRGAALELPRWRRMGRFAIPFVIVAVMATGVGGVIVAAFVGNPGTCGSK